MFNWNLHLEYYMYTAVFVSWNTSESCQRHSVANIVVEKHVRKTI